MGRNMNAEELAKLPGIVEEFIKWRDTLGTWATPSIVLFSDGSGHVVNDEDEDEVSWHNIIGMGKNIKWLIHRVPSDVVNAIQVVMKSGFFPLIEEKDRERVANVLIATKIYDNEGIWINNNPDKWLTALKLASEGE